MITKQIGSIIEPLEGENTLALVIKCPECDTQRAFSINKSNMLLVTRQVSGVEYESWCTSCDRRISVQIAWTKRHFGWTAEKISFRSFNSVEDTTGMSKSQGEKLI